MTAPDVGGRELIRLMGGPVQVARAGVIRDFVRSIMVPDVIARLYDVGTGRAEFETLVYEKDGARIVQMEAPPAVQVAALRALMEVGVPRQLGITDGADRELPGVFVLGGPGLVLAREVAGRGGYMGQEVQPDLPPDRSTLSADMQARVEAGEFEVVEVDDSPQDTAQADQPDPIVEREPTLEQQILAKRRKGKR